MDVFSLYLSTSRYVLSATPNDRSTWCDIFKYLPCLRHLLSCSVCGGLARVPHVSSLGLCCHHVCQVCLGSQTRRRPSCHLCKDHSNFKENKRLRVLIMCFKKLCAYISHSHLGSEIAKASLNGYGGYGNEGERTLAILEEAEQFQDDYMLTPPPSEFSHSFRKSASRVHKQVFVHAGKSGQGFSGRSFGMSIKRKRGRPKRAPLIGFSSVNMSSVTMPSINTSLTKHAQKLKKMAVSSAAKRSSVAILPNPKRMKQRFLPQPEGTGLLITQRPHRDKSGKSSIGQLWRETFLDDVQQQIHPDLEKNMGKSLEKDNSSNSQKQTKHKIDQLKSVISKSSEITKNGTGKFKLATNKSRRKETRFQKHQDTEREDTFEEDVTSTTDEIQKPRLTLTISKQRYQPYSQKGRSLLPASSLTLKDSSSSLEKQSVNTSGMGVVSSTTMRSLRNLTEICRCARSKQYNQMTCAGQKCPCHSNQRACMDCQCTGCRNPIRFSDSAPYLTHMRDSDGLEPGLDRSMPRLSPVPHM